jgi:hypothetical protein
MEDVKNGELRLASGAGAVSDPGSVDGDFRSAVEWASEIHFSTGRRGGFTPTVFQLDLGTPLTSELLVNVSEG